MQRSPSFFLRIAAFAPYALICVAVITATFYAFPQTDDYCTFGRLALHSGGNPLLETWYLYNSWTGRYSSSLVVALVGWLTSVSPAPLHVVYSACLAMLVATFALACMAVSRLVGDSRNLNLALAALIFASSLVLMPSKLEEYLWLTGAAVYFAGISVLLFTAKALADRQASVAPGPRYDWPLLCLIIACVGFNEFLAIALGGYLILVTAVRAARRESVRPNLQYFVAFTIAFLVTVLAPGNFARDAGIASTRHDVVQATRLAMESLSVFKSSLIDSNAILLTALMLASACAGWLAASTSAERAYRFLPLPVTLILSFPMHLWTFSFLTGEATPGRVINQAFVLALVGVMMLLAWLTQRALHGRRPLTQATALGVVMLAGLALISSAPFKQLTKSTREFAPAWRYQQLQRQALLVSASRNGVPAVVNPIVHGDSQPPIFQGGDVTEDPGNWINRCVADYYAVQSVRLQPTQ